MPPRLRNARSNQPFSNPSPNRRLRPPWLILSAGLGARLADALKRLSVWFIAVLKNELPSADLFFDPARALGSDAKASWCMAGCATVNLALGANAERRSRRVFRKPSEESTDAKPVFRGFPRCRLCVLKILGFRTGSDLLYCGRRGGKMTKIPGQEGRQAGRHLSARFDNRADDDQSTPRTARRRQAPQLVSSAGVRGRGHFWSQGSQRPAGARRIAQVGGAP